MSQGAADRLRALREGKTPPKKKAAVKPANAVQAVQPKKSYLAKPKKPIARKTPIAKPKKKIRKVAKKRAAETRIYDKVKDDYLAQHPLCEIRSPVCSGQATCINHKAGRIGKRLFDVTKFEASCSPCNGYIEEHPELDNFAHKEQHNTENPKR